MTRTEYGYGMKKPDVPFKKYRGMKQVVCAACGTTTFEVGQEYYFTLIRCTQCGRQVCVHEG